MKKIMNVLLLLASCLGSAQYALARINDEHKIYFDLGGLRNSYYYPIMDLGYSSKTILALGPLTWEAQVRSYGTYFIYNPDSYDLTCVGKYAFRLYQNTQWDIQTFLGLGGEARLRFARDARSRASSSVEPLLACGFEGAMDPIGFQLPLRMRWYSDGYSIQILPEISWRWNAYGVFVRSELAFLTLNDNRRAAWAWNNFAGVRWFFK